ncbi:hypothetical protein ACSSS7_005967 [Eimeria intestinalis]
MVVWGVALVVVVLLLLLLLLLLLVVVLVVVLLLLLLLLLVLVVVVVLLLLPLLLLLLLLVIIVGSNNQSCGVPETAICLYRRWVMIEPERGDEYAMYLKSVGRYDEAASQLASLASDPSICPASGRSRHDLWLELCNLVAAHPESIHSMRVEDILRSGISRFSDAVGSLWCSLASHYVRIGLLAKARDIYEEAVSSVSTIRDLALIYEAYAAFEEAVVAQLLQQQQEGQQQTHHHQQGNDAGAAAGAAGAAAAAAKEIDFAIARLERLTERRPLLLSSCKLRQNPHNVHEWLARAELLQDDPKKVCLL